MNKHILTATGIAALALLSQSQQADAVPVATISGAYDYQPTCSYDTPCLVFHNTSAYDITGAQMVLKGYTPGSLNYNITQTVSLPDILAGTDYVYNWSGPTTAGNLTAYDYDDEWGFQGACPFGGAINAGLCAQVGNFKVTFTGTWDSNPVFSVFSPDSNYTGGYVGWEGLDPNGWSENPSYDVHSGSLTGTLAVIDIGTPLPEPASLALLGIGLAGLGAARRRKQQ